MSRILHNLLEKVELHSNPMGQICYPKGLEIIYTAQIQLTSILADCSNKSSMLISYRLKMYMYDTVYGERTEIVLSLYVHLLRIYLNIHTLCRGHKSCEMECSELVTRINSLLPSCKQSLWWLRNLVRRTCLLVPEDAGSFSSQTLHPYKIKNSSSHWPRSLSRWGGN